MRIRVSLLGVALLIGLPWLFAATALQGSCGLFPTEDNGKGRPRLPADQSGQDGASGQAQAVEDLRTMQADDPGGQALQAAVDAGAAQLIAANVADFGELAGGRIICSDMYGRVFTVGHDGKDPQAWSDGWDAKAAGWAVSEDPTQDIQCNALTVSPDGKWVALSRPVLTPAVTEGESYFYRCNAIVLASADGGDGRCIALADETDGGPAFDFSQDSSRVMALWFMPGEPTHEHYAKLMNDSGSDMELWEQGRYSYIEVASGERGLMPNYDRAEWYDKSPLSDNFSFEDMDTPGITFMDFMSGAELGRFEPASTEEWPGFREWVLPDAQLVGYPGALQRLLHVDGSMQESPGIWRCFCSFDDGACLFSRDGGASIEYGRVNWDSFSVDWSTARPDLAAFAEPWDAESGWPSRIQTWRALRSDNAALVREPYAGGLYRITLEAD